MAEFDVLFKISSAIITPAWDDSDCRSFLDPAIFFVFHNMDSVQYKLFCSCDTWVVHLAFSISPAAWQGSHGSSSTPCQGKLQAVDSFQS